MASLPDNTGLPPPYEIGNDAPNASGDPPRWAPASDPPAFDADIVPGYDTTTPSKLYNIGKLSTLPLVTISEVKAHLLLLGAFERLRQTCEEAEVVDVQKKLPPLRKEAKWPLFLERARERFDIWVAKVINGRPGRISLWSEEIPPLDVLLIWHAYMLNPIQYHEDVTRLHPILNKVPEFPLYKIASQIDLETLEMLPTEDQYHHYQRTTGDCFGLPLNTTPDADTINIKCPSCAHVNEICWIFTPDSADKLRGYAQSQFLVACEGAGCGFSITWDALCTKRFAEDVVTCLQDPGATLGGTLMNTSSGSPDALRGRQLTEDILSAFPSIQNAVELADSLHWSMHEVSKRLEREFEAPIPGTALPHFGKARVPSLLAAYSTPRPGSFGLVGSAHRLSIFTTALHDLGYLTPGIFDQDGEPLALALDRFHGFLDVATRGSSKRPMVPTLDVDLVWHTMMLRPSAYRDATMKFVGRVLLHDDMIEEGKMSLAFDEAAGIWKERQKTQFSTCGCFKHLGPTASSSSSTLKFWKKPKQDTLTSTSNIVTNHPPDSVDTNLATHPSDHSSIVVQGHERVEWLRERRKERFAEDSAKSSSNGKGKSRVKEGPETEVKEVDHQRAFLRTVQNESSSLENWGLRAELDPRIVDGRIVNRGAVVVGVETQVAPITNMRTAAAAASGFSATSTGW